MPLFKYTGTVHTVRRPLSCPATLWPCGTHKGPGPKESFCWWHRVAREAFTLPSPSQPLWRDMERESCASPCATERVHPADNGGERCSKSLVLQDRVHKSPPAHLLALLVVLVVISSGSNSWSRDRGPPFLYRYRLWDGQKWMHRAYRLRIEICPQSRILAKRGL